MPALRFGGFLVASGLYLVAAMALFGVAWRIVASVTVGTLLLIWLVFVRMFGVPL